MSEDLGFANCPAILPTFITGSDVANIKTADICRNNLKISLMLSGLCSAKDSAQSPPWSKNAFPWLAKASFSFRSLASPAKTSGG